VDTVKKRRITYPWRESNPGRPTHSLSLYRYGYPGSVPPRLRNLIFSPQIQDRLWGIFSLPGIKWRGREADHSPSSNAKDKYAGTIPSMSCSTFSDRNA
jgi:hypothetical protein